MVTTEARGELARNAIGLREVLFQSITHMAPGAAVAFSIIVGANFAAGALPLSILFALVGCLFVALSIGQLAKHLPSAAGFATYTSRGLHPSVGFMVAWGYALAEALVAPLLYLIFANVVAGTLAAEYRLVVRHLVADRGRRRGGLGARSRLVRHPAERRHRNCARPVRDRRLRRARRLDDPRGGRGNTLVGLRARACHRRRDSAA